MAKTTKQAKNKAKKRAKSSIPYVRRVVEDEHIQEQLRSAVGALRAAYGRVSRQGGRAAEDKRLYANLRRAAISIRDVAGRLQHPKPQPKRHLQKLAAGTLAGGSALLVFKQQKARSRDDSGSSMGIAPTSAPAAGSDASERSPGAEPSTTKTAS